MAASLYPLWSLSSYLLPYRFVVALAAIALLLACGFYLALPISIRYFFDYGLNADNSQSVSVFWLGVAVAFAFSLTSAWRFYLVSWLGERVVADIRVQVFSRVLHFDMLRLESLKIGEILSRLSADTTLIEQIVGTSLSMALRNSLSLLGGLVMIFLTSWQLSLLVLVITPCVLVPLLSVLRWQRRLSKLSQDAVASTNAYAAEVLHAIVITQAFCHQSHDIRRYRQTIENAFLTARQRILIRSLLTVIVVFFTTVALLSVLWFGFYLLRTVPAQLSPGQLAQFLGYAVIVAVSAAALSEVWGDIQRASGASDRILELLQVSATLSPSRSLVHEDKLVFTQGMRFCDITFAYPSRPDISVLQDISLHVKSGQVTALVGQSGSGKSTMLSLLLRFYDFSKGTIEFAGHDIKSIDVDIVRRNISYVPQEVVVFSGSIFDNIAYGRPDATKDDVMLAAKLALVDEFAARLPQKYATEVGERGMRLSGGQKQRIAIARAFLRDAPVLFLDEATSALDTKNEALLQDALLRLMQKRTTIVIAHRLSTVSQADCIVFMHHGNVIAKGSHKQLLSKSPEYVRFVNHQLQKTE
tara:strand:- start:255 stop:2009 length:1755 start_codon:yes stop_codon:yes gene_type:complete